MSGLDMEKRPLPTEAAAFQPIQVFRVGLKESGYVAVQNVPSDTASLKVVSRYQHYSRCARRKAGYRAHASVTRILFAGPSRRKLMGSK
jgi:hypothetical protein